MCQNAVVFCRGCSNRSDKDLEKRLNFHNLPFRNKELAEKWLDQLRRDARFTDKKKLENVYFCNEHFSVKTKINKALSFYGVHKGLFRSHLQIRNVQCEDKKEDQRRD